jgi:hypothetical protein
MSEYGIWMYEENQIHPDYKYTITRTNAVEKDVDAGLFFDAFDNNGEIRCRVDIFKADSNGVFDDIKIEKSFFINVPINQIKE